MSGATLPKECMYRKNKKNPLHFTNAADFKEDIFFYYLNKLS